MSEMYFSRVRNVRIAPRKVRLVLDLVRGKSVQDAVDTLKLLNKRSSPVLTKAIQSAIANAKAKATVDIDRLIVKTAYADGGAVMRRYLPRAQGRATPIRKRTSHIVIGLSEI